MEEWRVREAGGREGERVEGGRRVRQRKVQGGGWKSGGQKWRVGEMSRLEESRPEGSRSGESEVEGETGAGMVECPGWLGVRDG